ncbi:MAG: hypothetical protein U0230_25235 [Polyangiales bacterium]
MAAGTTHGRDVRALVADDDPRDPGSRASPRRSSVPPLLPKTKSGIFAVGTRRPIAVHVPPNPAPNLEDLPTLDGDPEDEEDTLRIRRVERVDIDSVLRRVSSVPPPPLELRRVEIPKAPPARPSLEPPDPLAVEESGSFLLRALGYTATIVLLAGAITLLGRAAVLVVDIARHVRTTDATARLTSVHRESHAMRTAAMPTQLFGPRVEASSAPQVAEPTTTTPSVASDVPFVGPPMPEPEVAIEPEPTPAPVTEPHAALEPAPTAPRSVEPARAEARPVAAPTESALAVAESVEGEEAPTEDPVDEAPPAPADPVALALAARLDPPPVEAPPPSIPSRDEVGRALRAVAPQVNACSTESVVLTVRVTFASDGSVTAARLATTPPGTTNAACVWEALRAARVSPFGRSSFTTSYAYARP